MAIALSVESVIVDLALTVNENPADSGVCEVTFGRSELDVLAQVTTFLQDLLDSNTTNLKPLETRPGIDNSIILKIKWTGHSDKAQVLYDSLIARGII